MRRSEAGFTLIELLVTITLLSLLVLVLFGGLQFGVRAWDGAQAHGEGMDELRLVQDILRREIEQAYPRYDAADPLHPVLDFEGDESRVAFIGPVPQAAGDSAARVLVTIAGEPDGGMLQLVLHAAPDGAAWSAPLLRNVAALRFSYFDGVRWSASWRDAKTLPRLVRLQVAFRKGDRRVWPDLVVAPRIDVDSACVYDYAAQRCEGRP
ncbi:MAG: prepilin-type N-terminal cleavage/methylation domain-containing protein [Rhizomicrobium sp.]